MSQYELHDWVFAPTGIQHPLQNWGLTPIQTQQEEEIKIPLGIVIPWFVDGHVWKISIRRPDKSYFQVLGSSDSLYGIDDLQPDRPAMLFESEFDALSAMQEVSDLAACVATGGASKGQSSPLKQKLKQASHLLVCFDNDEAGDTGSSYWLKAFKNALRWTPWAHDCNDMLCTGLPVRMWVEMGLKAAVPMIVEPPQSQETEPLATPAVQETTGNIRVKRQLPPWVKVNDRGLPEFCSIGMCRNRAIAWASNATIMDAYCATHKPKSFGWTEKYLPLVTTR